MIFSGACYIIARAKLFSAKLAII